MTGHEAAESRTPFVPDSQQQRAIDHPLTPLRIVAGAGSGKTEVMAQRVVSLVERGLVADHDVLGLTFSNKAASNLRDRIVRRLGPGNGVHVATYHGFGAQIIREHAIALGLPAEPRLLDRARSFQLLLEEFNTVDLPHRKLGRPAQIVEETLTLASSLADHLVPVDALRADCLSLAQDRLVSPWVKRVARSRADLCIMLDAYAAAKRRLGVLDFGDQIALAVLAVRRDPSIARSLRQRYRAVLLDEFQDTNVAQRELIKMIWVDGYADGHAPITAVGDDLQSIYGFRGAHVDNLIYFDRHVPGTTTADLETNYRSNPTIVALANHVHANISVALPKTLRSHLDADTSTSPSVESFVAADDRAEAQAITLRVARVGAPWSEIAILCRKRRLIGPIAEALEEAGIPVEIIGLGGLLVRPEVVDTVAWLQLLACPDGAPEANVAFLRLAQGPSLRLGLRDLAALTRADRADRAARSDGSTRADGSARADRMGTTAAPFGPEVDDDADVGADVDAGETAPIVDPGLDLRRVLDGRDVPGLSAAAWSRLAVFRSTVSTLRGVLERRSLTDVIEAVIASAGLWSVVDAVGHENLLRFVHLAHCFEPLSGPLTVSAFLDYLALVALSEDDPAEATSTAVDAVQLMTIHQSKGLEFDTVFVPGLSGSGSSRIFPDRRATSNGATVAAALPHWLRLDNDGFVAAPRSRDDEARLKSHVDAQQSFEELRLLYVALTRARRSLTVSAAQWYSGPQKPQGVSEFYDLLTARSDLVTETERASASTENPELETKKRRQEAARSSRAATAPPEVTGRTRRASPPSPALFELSASAQPQRTPSEVALTTTAVVTYAQCPQRYEWSFARRLPRRSSPAADFGTALHRWIEGRSFSQFSHGFNNVAALDPDDMGTDGAEVPGAFDSSAERLSQSGFDQSPTEVESFNVSATERARRWERSQTAFLDSPYANLVPQRVEAPFAFDVPRDSGLVDVVRGRIDAVYEREDMLEIVDFKTGRFPYEDDSSAKVQLDVYALVAVDQWGVSPDRLRTSFVYLAPGESTDAVIVSTDWDADALSRVRSELAERLAMIDAGQFSPHGGPWCGGCDFASFCPGASSVAGVNQ